MHELSIAMSIIDIAEEEAERLGNPAVISVRLKLGKLSGVVREALESAFELAREETVLAQSMLVIEEVPIVVYCLTCQAEQTIDSIQLCCPQCGAACGDIRGGRELEVTGLEIQE